MAALCIPKLQANKLINSLKDGGFNRLSDMSSAERREFFSKNIGEEMSQKVNAAFEKALAKNTREALSEFAKKVTGDTTSGKKDVIERIANLDEKGLLDGNILEDHISEVLGAKVTAKEVAEVKRLGKAVNESKTKLDVEQQKVISEGKFTPEYRESLIQYTEALKEADLFMLRQSRTGWSETTWNHAKASMLLNPASWAVNIESNTVNAGIQAIERRVAEGRMTGYSSDLAKEWKKTMLAVRQKTGYDMSRALSIDEMLEKKIIGEQLSIGRDTWFTKFVYNVALGKNDAWAARMAFADSLNLNTANLVHAEGLSGAAARTKAREIFLDAIQVKPQTELGRTARKIAVEEAQVATWTNDGVIARRTLALKQGLNKFAEEDLGLKGFKVGDMLEPFVKTPANIVQYGFDAGGLGLLRGAGKMASLMKNSSKLTSIQKKRLLGESLRDMLRTGIGVGGAAIAASFIPAENFMGAYDPNRWKYEQLRNSNSNSIRIGDKWYSLDYAGGFAAPLVAVLYAKKYGQENTATMVGSYLMGLSNQALNIPFVGSVADLVGTMGTKFDAESKTPWKDMGAIAYEWFNTQVTSRVPGISMNIAKLFDDKEREAKGLMQNIQSKIPGMRNALPEKQNMLGETMKTEAGANPDGMKRYLAMLTQIMAGARIKTAVDTPYGNEIMRLKDAGMAPSFTSWKFRLGERQTRLKEIVGDEKYNTIFREEYGKEVTRRISEKLKQKSYQDMSDEDKKGIINKIDDEVIKEIYSRYDVPLKETEKKTSSRPERPTRATRPKPPTK